MPIPEGQLETWSHQGPSTAAKAAHESIRAALSANNSPIRDKNVEVYLQGSYRNDTNIRADSDVDVVVQLNSTIMPNIASLSEAERSVYHRTVPNATYLFDQFRNDVWQTLSECYGASAVEQANKCIVVHGNSGGLTADVVPCLEYRLFTRFQSWNDQQAFRGIWFTAKTSGEPIVNFPKLHYDNGVAKNAANATNGWYKPTVRAIKSARNYMAAKYQYPVDHAPSYFLECLVYNVPNSLFGRSYQDTVGQILRWIFQADLRSLYCQNGMTPLFGEASTQWNTDHALEFATTLTALWQNWR